MEIRVNYVIEIFRSLQPRNRYKRTRYTQVPPDKLTKMYKKAEIQQS